MKPIPPSPLADADLSCQATKEGRKACEELFALQAKPGATCLAEQVETGRFPPEIEKIMRLFQNVERIEGLLLQTVSGLALAALPGFDVLTNRRVRVTDADRSLVASEPRAALSGLRPPRAGKPVGSFEFDHVAFNQDSGELFIVDVKRALNDKESGVQAIKEGAVAFRRLVGDGQGKVRLVMLRWFARPRNFYGLDVTTRKNIDATFKAPVCNVVETALNAYREALFPRLIGFIAGLNISTELDCNEVFDASSGAVSFEALRLLLEGERQHWRRP